MSLIVGRTNEVGLPIEGWNGEHLVSFKLGTSEKNREKDGDKEEKVLLALTFSDGTKVDLKGSEAQVFYDKVILKNFQVSLTAVQLGSANKMLNTLQNQVGVARKKAEKEAETAKKPDTNFRRMM